MSDFANQLMASTQLQPAAQEPPNPIAPGVPMDPNAQWSLEDTSLESDTVYKRESDKIYERAKERFDYCVAWEANTRTKNLDDQRFVESDAYNNNQWPGEASDQVDDELALVINETRQMCLKITNELKENRPALKARATGGAATRDSAEIYTGLYRYIEYRSQAADAYDLATDHMVKMGIGYWRVVNDYVAPDSFDQDIYIRRIKNPLSVYLDPDIMEPDGSDARFGFIFDDVPRDRAEVKYPEYKKYFGHAALGATGDWLSKDHVRIAEYFERDPKPDVLYSFVDPSTGQRGTVLESQCPKEVIEALKRDPMTRFRKVEGFKVQWYLIIGNRVVKKREIPCKYIPIVRVVAEETIVDGIYDRKGHVRALLDPQRILNYWASSAVKNVALQTQTPYMAPAESIEEYQNVWSNANTDTPFYLPYKHRDGDGNEIPRPERVQPPSMAPAYIQGMEIARQQMMTVSGQYEAQMGTQGPENTGKAIRERRKPGDRATFHYGNALARAISFTGRIMIDMAPQIYDTPRTLLIMGEDGEQSEVRVDPTMQQASQEAPETKEMEAAVQRVFNPKVGQYEVQAAAGPSWGTRREEAFDSLTQMMVLNPALASVIGDLVFQSADFPLSEEAAKRLKRMVPLQALGNEPPPEVKQLMQTAENLQASLASAIQALADKENELKNLANKTQVDSYRAETDRLDVIMDKLEILNPKALTEIIAGVLMSMQNTPLPPPPAPPTPNVELPTAPGMPGSPGAPSGAPGASGNAPGPMPEAIQEGLDVPETIQGIRQARSGRYYLPDPQRPGKYVEIS